MENSTDSRDYLNLIERALMMGISDNLNSLIKTSDYDIPITASQLNTYERARLDTTYPPGFDSTTQELLKVKDFLFRRFGDYSEAIGDRDYSVLPMPFYADWVDVEETVLDDGTSLTFDPRAYSSDLENETKLHDGNIIIIRNKDKYATKIFKVKSSGADITRNEFNIGATTKETMENFKAAIEHKHAFGTLKIYQDLNIYSPNNIKDLRNRLVNTKVIETSYLMLQNKGEVYDSNWPGSGNDGAGGWTSQSGWTDKSMARIKFVSGSYPAAGPVLDEAFTLISTDGTSKTYTAKNASNYANNEFNRNITDDDAYSLVKEIQACVSHASGHGGKISAITASTGGSTFSIDFMQNIAGPAGNTTVTSNLTGGTKTNFKDNLWIDKKEMQMFFPNIVGSGVMPGTEEAQKVYDEDGPVHESTIYQDSGATTTASIAATTTDFHTAAIKDHLAFTVSDISKFTGKEGKYIIINEEILKINAADAEEDVNGDGTKTSVPGVVAGTSTLNVRRAQLMGYSYGLWGNAYGGGTPWVTFSHSSGTKIYHHEPDFINDGTLSSYITDDMSEWGIEIFKGEATTNYRASIKNAPGKDQLIAPEERSEQGFHVYGAFPTTEDIQFPAIVVQQVASGFEEKFFGDSVTFGSDTTTSSGEVYGMTFLIHIFTDKETIIPLGLTARYGQRRLTNWMMLNIANVIQGLDWEIYQEQELEIIERHLNQWRDIGYMPQSGWHGATAEFDIFFLNKR